MHFLTLLLLPACFLIPLLMGEFPDDTGTEADVDVDVDVDVDTGGETDTDTRTDTDTGTRTDTGIARLAYVAEFTHTYVDGVYTFGAGKVGFGAYGIMQEDWVCTLRGDLRYERAAPAGCPGCLWAFDLSAPTDSLLEGSACDDLLEPGVLVDGGIDERFDYSWGFAASHTHVQPSGTYEFEETVFFHGAGPSDEWAWIAYNSEQLGRIGIEGTATDLSFVRLAGGHPGIYYEYFLE